MKLEINIDMSGPEFESDPKVALEETLAQVQKKLIWVETPAEQMFTLHGNSETIVGKVEVKQ